MIYQSGNTLVKYIISTFIFSVFILIDNVVNDGDSDKEECFVNFINIYYFCTSEKFI